MLSLAFILVFVFCAAIAVASLLVGHQFITTYNTEFHRNYFYYLVTFFSFAFYGIWAPIITRALLSSTENADNVIGAVANFLPVLGIPFLVISWIMLVKMAFSLIEVPSKNRVFRIHLVFLVLVMAAILGGYFFADFKDWFFGEQFAYVEMGIFMGLELGYMLLFTGIVWYYSKKQKRASKKIIRPFVQLMLLALLLRITVLPLAFSSPWILAVLILLYFLSNFIPLFYLKLNSYRIFAPLYAEHPNEAKKEFIYRRYQISKREKEVVEQICLGKTNQQIADELFISLQTVKDHTHRIYTKIGINSRMKLVQMVNG